MWLAAAFVAAARAAPATHVSMSIVGPGSSASDPALGTYVSAKLAWSCAERGPHEKAGVKPVIDKGPVAHRRSARPAGAAPAGGPSPCTPPPWLRIDRLDGVTDTSPYVRIADEAASFLNAPRFPFWTKPEWGPIDLYFGGSVDNKPIPFVASGWSSNLNGQRLTPNSSMATLYFTPAFEEANFTLLVEDLGPGTVRLSVKPASPGMPAPDGCRFDRFVLSTAPGGAGAGPAQFTTSFFYHEESESMSVVVPMQQPGIVYYGATPSFRGREGACTAGGVYDGAPSTHPLALVLAGPDGSTGNESLPPGFAGAVHRMVPLPTPHQFCVIEPNITLFSGSKLYAPLCRPDPKQEIPKQPAFVSLIAPDWLGVYPLSNASVDPAYVSKAYVAHVNATKPAGAGATRTTFATANPRSGRWSTYNNHVPLYFEFKPSRVTAPGGQPVELKLLIHSDVADADTVPVSRWQTLRATLAATPTVTPQPSRLVTSFTWASFDMLLGGERGHFLDTYRRLGLNTVPLVSCPGAASTAPAMFPGNRTAAAGWGGLMFGPELSAFVPSSASAFVCKKAPNASLLPPGLAPAQREAEMQKWQRAFEYANATGSLDIAYDGVFYARAAGQFCNLTAQSQPEWIFLDDERWQWDPWLSGVAKSANAAARRRGGESDEDLARRMVSEALGDYTRCLATVSPKTTVGWYGDPFPDDVMASNGISEQPSEYGPQHYLASFAGRVRDSRLRQSPMSGGRPRHLLPWLTACTYGQMQAPLLLSSTLHMFGGGATGFSFFIDSCIDDPGKMLALATAVQYAVHFEDHFLEGAPLIPDIDVPGAGQSNIRVWSGVRLGSSSWVVVTAADPTEAASLPLSVPVGANDSSSAGPYFACDLTTGKAQDIGTGPQVTVAVPPAGAASVVSVFHVSPDAKSTCEQRRLPSDAWLPRA